MSKKEGEGAKDEEKYHSDLPVQVGERNRPGRIGIENVKKRQVFICFGRRPKGNESNASEGVGDTTGPRRAKRFSSMMKFPNEVDHVSPVTALDEVPSEVDHVNHVTAVGGAAGSSTRARITGRSPEFGTDFETVVGLGS